MTAEKIIEEPITIVPRPISKPAATVASFKLQQYVTNRWVVSPPDGVSFERVLESDFWQHVAFNMRPGDIIEVQPEKGDYFAELIVRSANRTEANLFVLRHISLTDVQTKETLAPITIKWRGPVAKYCLMRGDLVVATGYINQEDALKATGDYAKEFAA